MKLSKINMILQFTSEHMCPTVSIFKGAGRDKVPYWMTHCSIQIRK